MPTKSWFDDYLAGNVEMEGANAGRPIPQALNEGNITNPGASMQFGAVPIAPEPNQNMTPMNISDESVRNFVRGPYMSRAMGWQNIGNVPMGEDLRLRTNTPLPTPEAQKPTTGGGGAVVSPIQAPMKSILDQVREMAARDFATFKSGQSPSPLSMNTMNFMGSNNVGGGGIVDHSTGKVYTSFEQNSPDPMAAARDQLNKQIGAFKPTGNPLADQTILEGYTKALNQLSNVKYQDQVGPAMAEHYRQPQIGSVGPGSRAFAFRNGGFMPGPVGEPVQKGTWEQQAWSAHILPKALDVLGTLMNNYGFTPEQQKGFAGAFEQLLSEARPTAPQSASSQTRAALKSKGYSDQQIDAYLRSKGIQ